MKIYCSVIIIIYTLLVPFSTVHAENPYKKIQPLLVTSETVLNEQLRLSDGSPLKITSHIVTISPGEETAWHKHGAPIYAYILSGEVTVDYGDKGTRTFGPGTAFLEAMNYWHRGTNRGKDSVRILVVYMGSDKVQNVIPKE